MLQVLHMQVMCLEYFWLLQVECLAVFLYLFFCVGFLSFHCVLLLCVISFLSMPA